MSSASRCGEGDADRRSGVRGTVGLCGSHGPVESRGFRGGDGLSVSSAGGRIAFIENLSGAGANEPSWAEPKFLNIGTRTAPKLAAPVGVEVEWKGAQPTGRMGLVPSRPRGEPEGADLAVAHDAVHDRSRRWELSRSVKSQLKISFFILLASFTVLADATGRVLRTTAEIRALSVDELRNGRSVDLAGQLVAHLFQGEWIMQDETGCYNLSNVNAPGVKTGDIVHVTGLTKVTEGTSQCYLMCGRLVTIGNAPIPVPQKTTAANIVAGHGNYNPARVRGFITEAHKDELNPNWNYLVLRDNGIPLYVSVPNRNRPPAPLDSLVDAEVEMTGVVLPEFCADRMFVGPHLELTGMDGIRLLTPAPDDPFQSPALEELVHVSPLEIAKLRRRRVEGRVIAVWSDNKFLLRESSGRLIGIILAEQKALPQCGDCVQAVGFPSTDLFRINLARVQYRTVRPVSSMPAEEVPLRISPATILLDKQGRRKLKPSYHGKTISMAGIIRNIPSANDTNKLMNLDVDGTLVPVDVSANPTCADGLSIGCRIEATGVCIMEAESWGAANMFPTIGGFTLVPRTTADIRILSRSSWWTPVRLLIVICSLFAALVAFFIWNRILNSLVERRGRQLFREQIAHAGTSLKIGERTRLAVELHDSISQNLAGLACQIAAAKSAVAIGPGEVTRFLNTAEQMLLSSRTELRRCLWDLRGDTLEMADMSEAVTKTVRPVVGNAELFVGFNVPRSRLMDSTTHSILCIVRELSANAIRHGHATRIRIAGEFLDSTLSFSVRDNGCGFDVDNHPGLAEGHFGLAGIRERVDRLDGTFVIESDGTGTKARITLSVPHATGAEA